MPTKLKNLKVKRVALVDEGANPDAHIKFAKNRDVQPKDAPTEAEKGMIKRLIESIAKAFGVEPVEKGAFTFSEGEAKHDYERLMDCEIYPMLWAFMDSVRSILTDTEKGDGDKESLFKQSFAEFSDAFSKAIPNWAAGAANNIDVQKDTDTLVKMRDHLSELIEKSADEDDDLDSPDDNNTGDEPDDDGEERPPVMKGAIDMKFDTEKMTPEERERYEDLAKRYGHEDGEGDSSPAAAAPATAPAPASPVDDGDIYKGLHPAVKAELENLRKFREESEDRQYLEIAKRYTLLGKKPEELAPVLKALKAAGGSAYDDMIGLLDSNLAAVEKSGVFSEIGKRGSEGGSGDNAWGKIEAAAQEIQKSKPDMRWADAVDAACNAHPELVEEYEKNRRR